MSRHRRGAAAAVLAILGLAVAGCSSSQDDEPEASAAASADASTCIKDNLDSVTAGVLTVATGEPAFPPWVIDDKPESGQGFEAAVAYAAAERLGYADEDVTWIRTTFDSAIAPGDKNFDWNLQQYTITSDRQEAVDFSSPYYQAAQVIVTVEGSTIAGATTIAELKDAKLGAAVGSTSLDDAEGIIAPTQDVAVFNDNAAAIAALQNGQIDGIVVDLPTGLYLAAAEIEGGAVVGQLPKTASGETTDLGILLEKDSPMTACTSWAIDELRADGTLDDLETQWLKTEDVPVLQ